MRAIVAEKNPNFYDAANVKIDKIIYYPDEDRNELAKQFRAGEIDFVDEFASEQIDFLRRELPNETRIKPYLGVYYYPINMKKPPFDNPKVRRALSLAIDRVVLTTRFSRPGSCRPSASCRQGQGHTASPMSRSGPNCRWRSVRRWRESF